MGRMRGTRPAIQSSRISSMAFFKVGPTTSILLMNTSRGNVVLVRLPPYGFRLSLDPFWASKTTTQPSKTRKDRSTSAVKSTWPGVSIRLMVQSCHDRGTQAL